MAVLMSDLKCRLDLAELCISKGLTNHAAEIGVWRGYFSFHFLTRWPGKLYMIDPWCKLPDDEYDDIRNREYTPEDYKFVMRESQQFDGRAVPVKAKSLDVVRQFNDQSLDLVYIDANHSYPHVVADIYAWWDKLRYEGILSGHDFFALPHPCVTQAVIEFAAVKEVDVHIIPGVYNEHGAEVDHCSWYIVKPKP